MGRKTGPRSPASFPEGDNKADAVMIKITAASANAALAPRDCRRLPVKLKEPSRRGAQFTEIAGGKTAECVAICCCFPFGIVNLVILAVVRLPAGLCRRALRKRILLRRTKKKAKLLGSSSSDGSSTVRSASDEEFVEISGMRGTFIMVVGDQWPAQSPSAELIELEKDVWSKFYGSGFWRSPSEKEDL